MKQGGWDGRGSWTEPEDEDLEYRPIGMFLDICCRLQFCMNHLTILLANNTNCCIAHAFKTQLAVHWCHTEGTKTEFGLNKSKER